MYQYKSVTDSVVDVDDKSRRVKVAISEMGSVDSDNDIIDQNAYSKTIVERGPQGKNKIFHLTDHRADTKNVLGKFSELYVEGNKLIGVNNIVKTTWGNDVLEMYKSGTITEHSVGFTTIKADEGKNDEPRIIKEIKLWEGSAVLWGANENTPTLSVGKSYTRKEKEAELNRILKELSIARNFYKNGTFSDDLGDLMEIRILQLEEAIKALFSIYTKATSAANIVAQEPEDENPLMDAASDEGTLDNGSNASDMQAVAAYNRLPKKSRKPEDLFAEQLLLLTLTN
jgi:Escherichia/Staphylococcus phage prohead protease